MAVIDKKCSVCHKVSWRNVTGGTTRSTHRNDRGDRWLPCDTDGGTFINGTPQ